MSSVFQTFVKVFNRAPVPLSVTFDGHQYTIQPGFDDLPDLTVNYAKNQNPIMGSQDPNNPHMSGAQYLIVTEEDPGYGVPLTNGEWDAHGRRPCRLDEEAIFAERYANDPKARQIVMGKGRASTAGSRYEAGGAPGGVAVFSSKD